MGMKFRGPSVKPVNPHPAIRFAHQDPGPMETHQCIERVRARGVEEMNNVAGTEAAEICRDRVDGRIRFKENKRTFRADPASEGVCPGGKFEIGNGIAVRHDERRAFAVLLQALGKKLIHRRCGFRAP